MELNYVLIIAVIVVIMYLLNNKKENLTNLSNESLQNISQVYNSSNMNVTNLKVENDTIMKNANVAKLDSTNTNISDMLTTKDFKVSGNAVIDGALTVPQRINTTILAGNPGRLHITGDELLYLLNKNGVIIGKEWGGNGNLTVQGNLDLKGNLNLSGGTFRGGIRTFDNIQAGDGWDVWSAKVANNQACINACITDPRVRIAMYRKSDGQCWCKEQDIFKKHENNFMSTVIY